MMFIYLIYYKSNKVQIKIVVDENPLRLDFNREKEIHQYNFKFKYKISSITF